LKLSDGRLNFYCLFFLLLLFLIECQKGSVTTIEIINNKWHLNKKITYLNTPAEGLLVNVRMVNCTFADTSRTEIKSNTNTDQFISRIPQYTRAGIRAFTLNMQGGMPGYEGAVNSAFDQNGDLKPAYCKRVERVINACDKAGAAVILGCFYQRQDQILKNEKAVRSALKNTVEWIKEKKFTNILLEIANEYPHRGFDHLILKTAAGEVELIKFAKSLYPGLLVSTSGYGNGQIDSLVAEAADFILIHFNGVAIDSIPAKIVALKKYNKPILCNEDDKIGTHAIKAFRNSIQNNCSWGYMNKKINQYSPFEFNGADDDTLLYNAIRDITTTPLIFSRKDQKILTELESYVAGTQDALSPCSAGIVVSRGDSIIFEKYLNGTLPLKPDPSVNENSLWPMWSCTKSFISALLLSLVTDNIIIFDDPIAKYLPEFNTHGDGPFDRRTVTIRHVASHTSGVSYAGSKNQELILDPPLELNNIRIETDPGKVFVYSSLGMHILERTIEAATGEDLYKSLKERILKPLGLPNAQYISEYKSDLNMLPCKYGNFNNLVDYFALSEKGRRCGTGLYMTAKELNKFGQLMLSNGMFNDHKFFNADVKKQIWKYHGTRASDNGHYGLLWWLFENEGGYVISGASHTVTALVPESDIVVTVTRNHTGSHPGPFNYYKDKESLVIFGKKLGL